MANAFSSARRRGPPQASPFAPPASLSRPLFGNSPTTDPRAIQNVVPNRLSSED